MPAQDNSQIDTRVRDVEVRVREAEDRLRKIELEAAGVNAWIKFVTEQLTTYVTKSEFGPVKMIAYGLAGTVLTSILTAALAKLIVK